MDIRCDNGIKFAVLEDGVLEVKCRSSRCGASRGNVVLHEFSTSTGELIRTRTFRDPNTEKEKDSGPS